MRGADWACQDPRARPRTPCTRSCNADRSRPHAESGPGKWRGRERGEMEGRGGGGGGCEGSASSENTAKTNEGRVSPHARARAPSSAGHSRAPARLTTHSPPPHLTSAQMLQTVADSQTRQFFFSRSPCRPWSPGPESSRCSIGRSRRQCRTEHSWGRSDERSRRRKCRSSVCSRISRERQTCSPPRTRSRCPAT